MKKIDELQFVTGSEDKCMRVWKWEDGILVKHLNKTHIDFVTALEILDEDNLISGSRDKTIKVWNTHDWVLVLQAIVEEKISCLLKISHELIAGGTANGKIMIFSTEDWQCVFFLEGHSTANAVMQLI